MCCDKVAGYARAWARTSDLGRKTMAGGVCYLTTHTQDTDSLLWPSLLTIDVRVKLHGRRRDSNIHFEQSATN